MEDNKYSEKIKTLTSEQLIFEMAILEKEKTSLYIKEKELKNEFKRRLEEE